MMIDNRLLQEKFNIRSDVLDTAPIFIVIPRCLLKQTIPLGLLYSNNVRTVLHNERVLKRMFIFV